TIQDDLAQTASKLDELQALVQSQEDQMESLASRLDSEQDRSKELETALEDSRHQGKSAQLHAQAIHDELDQTMSKLQELQALVQSQENQIAHFEEHSRLPSEAADQAQQ